MEVRREPAIPSSSQYTNSRGGRARFTVACSVQLPVSISANF